MLGSFPIALDCPDVCHQFLNFTQGMSFITLDLDEYLIIFQELLGLVNMGIPAFLGTLTSCIRCPLYTMCPKAACYRLLCLWFHGVRGFFVF